VSDDPTSYTGQHERQQTRTCLSIRTPNDQCRDAAVINASRAKDVGSKGVAIPQRNNSIPFEKRIRNECASSRFFNMASRQSQRLRSQAGPLRKRTVDRLQVAFGNVDVLGEHRQRECCRSVVMILGWDQSVSPVERLSLGTVSCAFDGIPDVKLAGPGLLSRLNS
jgi:hypothetical protein